MKKLNEYLTYAFLFCLPFQIGKHFFPDYTLLSGVRIDYLSPTLYLTDLLAIAIIVLNIKVWRPYFTFDNLKYILLFIIINLFFALSLEVGIYKWLKIFELAALFIIFQKKTTPQLYVLLAFLAGGILELVLSLLQLSVKHSIQGPFYWLGERALTLSTPDVAKSVLNGVEFLRPYGTFSHPNSMGGFYALVYAFFLTYQTKEKLLKYALLFVSFALVLISFSKVAILAAAGTTIFYAFSERKRIDCTLCIVSRIIVVAVLAGLVFFVHGDPLSAKKRWDLVQNAWSIIVQHPFFGVGAGNYIIAQHAFPIYYPYFFLQPVHNIFLLLLAEMGILFYAYITPPAWAFFHKHKKHLVFLLCLGVVVFTGFFDHYWYTLQQNWLLLAVIFGYSSRTGTPPKSVLRTSL